MDDGEYFGDEQMRERDPLLFQRYMGKDVSPYDSQPRNLSESLVRNMEESNIQRRCSCLRVDLKTADFNVLMPDWRKPEKSCHKRTIQKMTCQKLLLFLKVRT